MWYGTSLDSAIQDRLVVSALQRANAVVLGLQRTRLDQHVQLRVFAEADHFFRLVAQELLRGVIDLEGWTFKHVKKHV